MAGLTRKLTLERLERISDGAGGIVEGWTHVTDHWAAIRARTARETVTAGRGAGRVSHRAEIRFLPFGDANRPVADQRFREGDRVFAIIGVSEADDRRQRLVCWLEEGVLS